MTPYTADALPEAEALVERDLETVVDAVRALASTDSLAAVVLLGGFARGEGTVVRDDAGRLHGFNDYDFLLIFDHPPAEPARYAALATDLAGRLGIDFVDLGLVTPRELRAATATLFWYELGEAHRVLWCREDRTIELPRFPVEKLERAEGSRLLLNRGMALLWGALRLWPEGKPGEGSPVADAGTISFTAIAGHKAILAVADALLLREGTYSIRQAERLQRLENRGVPAWAAPGLLEACHRAAEYRRRPRPLSLEEVVALWHAARAHHARGFRAAESWRLGNDFDDWDGHLRCIRGELLGRRVRSPRLLARGARALLAGRNPLDSEDLVFLRLPRLLHASDNTPTGPWRARARALVRRWHP